MSKINTIIISIVTVLGLTACASKMVNAHGPDLTRTVDVGKFERLDVAADFELYFTQSDTTSVSYVAPKSVVPYIEIKSDNNTLSCSLKHNSAVDLQGRKITVMVNAPNIEEIKAEASAIVRVPNGMVCDRDVDLIAITGGCIIINNLVASNVELDAANRGVITVTAVKAMDVSIDASSHSVVTFAGASNSIDTDAESSAIVNIKGLAHKADFDVESDAIINAAEAQFGNAKLEASSGAIINMAPPQGKAYLTKINSGGTINI